MGLLLIMRGELLLLASSTRSAEVLNSVRSSPQNFASEVTASARYLYLITDEVSQKGRRSVSTTA